MLPITKKIIAIYVLVAFLMIVSLGLIIMIHSPMGEMVGGCPLTPFGVTTCLQGNLASAFHHISAFQSFVNFLISFGITVTILLFLAFLFSNILFFLCRRDILSPALLPCLPNSSCSFNTTPQGIRILNWLSLLENSPAL